MKNYKFLVPLVLVVLFAASFYMLYDTKATEQRQYNEYIENARTYREQDIQVDAEANYKNALNLKPSLSLYIEIGEFYRDTNQTKKAINWGETIVDTYPKEVKGYEFLMELQISRKDYVACFELADEFQKRKLSSETMSNHVKSIEYLFFFNGEYQDVGIYSGGLCPILVGNKWGYVDTQGNKKVANKFVKVGAYSGELSPVIDDNGTAFYVDPNGNKKFVILDVENVKELGLIENGIYSLYDGSTWAFYNSEYKKLYGDYQDVSAMGNGVAAVKKDGKWSLINRDGKDLIGKTYEAVAMDEKLVVFRNDRIFVSDGSGYQMIDSTGKVYGDKKFQAVHIFNDTTNAAVMINGKWGFINAAGEVVIEPQYEDARSFANGYAAVKKDGKWGFINAEGKMVIEPQFKNAKDFNDHGCVFVIRQDGWELLRLYKYNY